MPAASSRYHRWQKNMRNFISVLSEDSPLHKSKFSTTNDDSISKISVPESPEAHRSITIEGLHQDTEEAIAQADPSFNRGELFAREDWTRWPGVASRQVQHVPATTQSAPLGAKVKTSTQGKNISIIASTCQLAPPIKFPLGHIGSITTTVGRDRLSPYQYRPLESNVHIRLLSLRPRKSKPGFRYNIVTMPLVSAPAFEAISYVWGDSQRSYQLNFFSGETLMLTKSLFEALPILGKLCLTGYFWIDQLCINQTHILERNHQVKVMGDIYRQATRVLVYIQKSLEFGFVNALEGVLTVTEESEFRQESLDQLRDSLEAQFLTGPLELGNKWSTVMELLDEEWFARAWCFQEVILAQEPLFVIGNRLASFDVLFRLALAGSRIENKYVSVLSANENITTHVGFLRLYAMAKLRSERATFGRCHDFGQILSDVAPHSLSSDPRDILYAFLGLLQDENVEIHADYEMSLHDVFAKAARAVVEGKQTLEILSFVPRQTIASVPAQVKASWAPD